MTSTTLPRNRFVVVERDPAAYRNGTVAEPAVRGPHARPSVPEAPRDERHALALFCFEAPDGPIGGYVCRVVSALARRGTPVHVYARHAFDAAGDVTVHAVGECDGADLPAQVEEFTRRAANAFLR